MSSRVREKFATQFNADLVEKRPQASPRANVMAAYQASHERFAALYEKLAE